MGGAGGVHVNSMIYAVFSSSEKRWSTRTTDLAPHMGRMLIHKRLGGVANEKFRHDEQSDIFFTVKCFLKDVTAIAIGSQFDDSTPTEESVDTKMKQEN
jgi:hypothetical protein